MPWIGWPNSAHQTLQGSRKNAKPSSHTATRSASSPNRTSRALTSHTFLLSFFLLPSLLVFSNLVVTFGRRPFAYPASISSLPRFSLPVPHSWTPTTVYKSQTPEVPPEAHHVQSLFSLHSRPLNLNRRENGCPTTCSLRGSNHTKFQMVTFRYIATVYSHPTVVAYAAAHPRRIIPKFGPYLLLQTLGEGEFCEAKLGLHMQWGEEVTGKLI